MGTGPCGLPTRPCPQRKPAASHRLPDAPTPLADSSVSKNTKLVPKPGVKTRRLPAQGALQDRSWWGSEEGPPTSPDSRPWGAGQSLGSPHGSQVPRRRPSPGEGTGRRARSSWECHCGRLQAAPRGALTHALHLGTGVQGRRLGRVSEVGEQPLGSQPEPLLSHQGTRRGGPHGDLAQDRPWLGRRHSAPPSLQLSGPRTGSL